MRHTEWKQLVSNEGESGESGGMRLFGIWAATTTPTLHCKAPSITPSPPLPCRILKKRNSQRNRHKRHKRRRQDDDDDDMYKNEDKVQGGITIGALRALSDINGCLVVEGWEEMGEVFMFMLNRV